MTFQTKYLQLVAVQPTADGKLTGLAAGNFRKLQETCGKLKMMAFFTTKLCSHFQNTIFSWPKNGESQKGLHSWVQAWPRTPEEGIGSEERKRQEEELPDKIQPKDMEAAIREVRAHRLSLNEASKESKVLKEAVFRIRIRIHRFWSFWIRIRIH